MRYQFYREHKYVSSCLNDVERLIAKTDFRAPSEVQQVANAFQSLAEMLKGHAQYENERLHTLLEKKRSKVHEHAAGDHAHQDEQLLEIHELIDNVAQIQGDDDRVAAGYQLYLAYRKFVADNLSHLHEEETLILPELQRLYTDEELRQVEASTYRIMTPDHMVHMMQELFPHMNSSDRYAFLSDIHDAQPEKFAIAWDAIAPTIDEKERVAVEFKINNKSL